MKKQHSMPFGAQVLEDGRVRFRLWAPAAEKITLCLEQPNSLQLPMNRLADGWFEYVTDQAGPGTRYFYQLPDGMKVPDPASRFNPEDVHGPSEVIDAGAYVWNDYDWKGRPWEETVLYELHVGTFSKQGTYAGVIERLDHLVAAGITAIELMPLADFRGARNWGYDGVLQFAPDSSYGRPEELKALIDAAHAKGLMVFLDVVYNHFGPEGNYLGLYAPQFFKEAHTPWGAAINYDQEHSRTVRDFFIHNTLYWLEEFHFDGLRFDAIHAIMDSSEPHILIEIADAVRQGPGKERHIHLALENDLNEAHYLGPGRFDAQWNDDFHHALHVLISGETDEDFSDKPLAHLARCLTEGFAYQGEKSVHRKGATRGTPCTHLPIHAFVSFLQNHDQVGNRAFGERIAMLTEPRALRAALAVQLLAPSPPLLFMGQEFSADTPFIFFCDFGPELAKLVTDGRRKEFARFPAFADAAARETIPDPNAVSTFEKAKLDWSNLDKEEHKEWLDFYSELLQMRQREIVPRLRNIPPGRAQAKLLSDRAMAISWEMGDGSRLALLTNLGPDLIECEVPEGQMLYLSEAEAESGLVNGRLAPWTTCWFLEGAVQ